MLQAAYDELLDGLTQAAKAHYRERLRALVVFGSVGRRTQRFDSDVDLLVVAEALPHGRMRRVEDFAPVETAVSKLRESLRARGITPEISPVFKSPQELEIGSLLLLDMVQDARVLFDAEDTFARRIDRLQKRLIELGSVRRSWRGGWYWHLKPDLRPGEVFEL